MKNVQPLYAQASKPDIESLCNAYLNRDAVIGVIGMGYVGIPLICAACDKGFKAIGFDIDQSKVDTINDGKSYLSTVKSSRIQEALDKGLLTATANPAALAEADAILMCVPTPLTKYREPDLSYIEKTAETIATVLRPGQLIILESTTYPGTMRDVVRPILEKTGLKSGVDFYLAYSPEREDPGNINFETSTIPKVVGGDGPDALRLAETMYAQFVNKIVPVSSAETAEAVKLTENIFRAVNIAMVNELKVIYDALDIDVWEVIDAAATKPFGFMPFYPGPGLGGHCIPIDPFYLTYKAREHEISTRFIELAGEINVAMPSYVVNKTAEIFDMQTGRGLKGAKVLLLGAAYKKNVSDTRESPFFALAELLNKRGAEISYHDPHATEISKTREHPHFAGMKSIEITPENVASYDVVLVSTDHDDVDYDLIREHAKLIVDTRNVYGKCQDIKGKIFKA